VPFSANERRQVSTVENYSFPVRIVSVEEPPPHDRFALPVKISGTSAVRKGTGKGTNQMRVQGVVQKTTGGRTFVIADRTGWIDIETSQTNDLKAGPLD